MKKYLLIITCCLIAFNSQALSKKGTVKVRIAVNNVHKCIEYYGTRGKIYSFEDLEKSKSMQKLTIYDNYLSKKLNRAPYSLASLELRPKSKKSPSLKTRCSKTVKTPIKQFKLKKYISASKFNQNTKDELKSMQEKFKELKEKKTSN